MSRLQRAEEIKQRVVTEIQAGMSVLETFKNYRIPGTMQGRPPTSDTALARGVEMKRAHRAYSKELKQGILAEIQAGMSVLEAAKKHGIPNATIANWIKPRVRHKKPAAKPARVGSLSESVSALRNDLWSLLSTLEQLRPRLDALQLLEVALSRSAESTDRIKNLKAEVEALQNSLTQRAVGVYGENSLVDRC